MQEGGGILAAQQTQVWIQPSLMAFLVAANTSPGLGHWDRIVQLLEEPALRAKILIKSSVINTPLMCCAVGKRFGSRMSLPMSRGASWKATIKWSCERTGRRHCSASCQHWTFCLRFISSCGTENSL